MLPHDCLGQDLNVLEGCLSDSVQVANKRNRLNHLRSSGHAYGYVSGTLLMSTFPMAYSLLSKRSNRFVISAKYTGLLRQPSRTLRSWPRQSWGNIPDSIQSRKEGRTSTNLLPQVTLTSIQMVVSVQVHWRGFDGMGLVSTSYASGILTHHYLGQDLNVLDDCLSNSVHLANMKNRLNRWLIGEHAYG